MFDRIAGRLRPAELGDDGGAAPPLARARRRAGRAVGPGDAALDVCCGTGDLALELRRRVGAGGRVVGCDFSEPMLDLAREKAGSRGAGGVASSGPTRSSFPTTTRSFDAVTVGFGVRNLADLDRGLAEMARVLRPGGRLVILEITQPPRPPLSTFYSLWFDRIVPLLGTFAGDRDAYTLPAGVGAQLPRARGLAAKMDAAGLRADPLDGPRRRDHRDPQRRSQGR